MIELSKNVRIISIHSAKGGVGKTMISQFLAHMLLTENEGEVQNGKQNRVVILDLDFAGTTPPDRTGNENQDEIELPSYLLRPPRFTRKEVEIMALFRNYLENNKPNHNLYPEGVDHIIDTVTSEGKRPVLVPSGSFHLYTPLNPALLFDQIFSPALCDFIFDIIDQIARRMLGTQLYFILDNPPGYSQLTPALEKKLFECGPEQSKILYVGTPDENDLQGCTVRLVQAVDRFIRYMDSRCVADALMSLDTPTEWLNQQLDETMFDQETVDSLICHHKWFEQSSSIFENCSWPAAKPRMFGLALNKILNDYSKDIEPELNKLFKKELNHSIEAAKTQTPRRKTRYKHVLGSAIQEIQVASLPFSDVLTKFYQKELYEEIKIKGIKSAVNDLVIELKDEPNVEPDFDLYLKCDSITVRIYHEKTLKRKNAIVTTENIYLLCHITRVISYAWDILKYSMRANDAQHIWTPEKKVNLLDYFLESYSQSSKSTPLAKDWQDSLSLFISTVFQQELKTKISNNMSP